MKFSIIMPVYNVEKYIEKAIKSILSQTYKNFELLIINDGTKDKSMEIISKYKKKDDRIKIYNKENGGLSSARNYGLKYATGQYICFIDSDDYVEDTLLEELNEEISIKKYDMLIYGYNIDTVNSNEQKVDSKKITEKSHVFSTNDNKNLNFKNISIIGYAWNKCYKNELIKNNSLKFEEGTSYIEDIIFNNSFFKISKDIKVMDTSLYHYIQRNRETLGRKSYNDMLELDLRYSKLLKEILLSLNNTEDQTEKIVEQALFERIKWSIAVIISDSSNSKKLILLNNYFKYLKDSYYMFSKNIQFNKKDKIIIWFAKRNLAFPFCFLSKVFVKTKKDLKKVKKVIPNHWKDLLKYYLSSSNIKIFERRDSKKIIIFLGADYGNLGDVAITESQINFLKKNFPDYEIKEIPISKTYTYIKTLKKNLTSKDIITLIGGGNISDLYEDIETQRRFIIGKFKKNRIVSFPQTVYFTDTKRGRDSMKKTVRTYKKHQQLYLFAREEKTYNFFKNHFEHNKIFMCPDIVLSKTLPLSYKKNKKNKIVLCIRNDKESAISQEQLKGIRKNIVDNTITFTDTQVPYNRMSIETRQQELKKIIEIFANSKLVITDRLHGMILCAITNTPCLAIDNSNGKVLGVYNKWLKENSSVRVVQSQDITKEMIEKAINDDKKYSVNKQQFDKIIDVIKG